MSCVPLKLFEQQGGSPGQSHVKSFEFKDFRQIAVTDRIVVAFFAELVRILEKALATVPI
jgi:hypothetical protein